MRDKLEKLILRKYQKSSWMQNSRSMTSIIGRIAKNQLEAVKSEYIKENWKLYQMEQVLQDINNKGAEG